MTLSFPGLTVPWTNGLLSAEEWQCLVWPLSFSVEKEHFSLLKVSPLPWAYGAFLGDSWVGATPSLEPRGDAGGFGEAREGGDVAGRGPKTPSHWEGSWEPTATSNRLIHNLWSQRKSLLLIIIIRHND